MVASRQFARQEKWLYRPSDSFIPVALAEKKNRQKKIAEAAEWNTTQKFRKILTGYKISERL